jgi:hypothetical protein
MTALPVKSWLSLSEGFLPPFEIVETLKRMGTNSAIFADSGEVGGIRDFLIAAENASINATVGVEFLLVHRGLARRASVFPKGVKSMNAFFKMVSKLYSPKDPQRPKAELLPGCDFDLPLLRIEDVPPEMILVSGGKESFFEDCRSRGDLRSFLEFVDEARKQGTGVAVGYDSGLADARDEGFLRGLKNHGKPVPILPWRWTVCESRDEERYAGAVRSVFGKSPDPVALRVGVAFDSLSSLNTDNQRIRDFEIFTKATEIKPGEMKFSQSEDAELLFKNNDGKTLSQDEACELLRRNGLKNLDSLMAKTGLKGERARERRKFYTDRMEGELKDINDCKVAGRILHVAELMSFCRKNGIKAMARGSVANSLICYLNRIHPINPVTFGLPSQRFVNPKRKTVPDIDIDIASSKADVGRAFLCKAGDGGVGLRSTVTAGFVDILQRELKAAGVPFAHELRNRLKISFGGRRVPNTYPELEAEYNKLLRSSSERGKVSDQDFISFICGKMPSANRETMEASIETARRLEGRPLYNIDHVGVAMRTRQSDPYSPVIKGANGTPVLAIPHEKAEAWGFSKIDVLSRKALDLVEKIQTSIEKNGGKLRSVGSVFTASRKSLPELRKGLVGGLDQIGGGRGQTPHRQFLSSWEDDFTNFDLINYLALVRYGTYGWSKEDRPSGEFRPKMLALYCGNFAAGSALADLGKTVVRRYRERLSKGEDVSLWTGLGNVKWSGETVAEGGNEDLETTLKNLPSRLAKMESLGAGDVGEQVLARITWDGTSDKKTHLAKCREAIVKKKAGSDNEIREIISTFYGIDPQDTVITNLSNSLSTGKVIERPSYIADLGKTGIEVWDKVTADTRGLLLFQEQVTDLLCRLSGCSYSSADLVRDAVAHKGRTIPEDVKKEITEGVENKTGVAGSGERILDSLVNDGPYLFNKGHAAAYAGLIMWQLEAKKNWPASFAKAYIDYLRDTSVKGSEGSHLLGGVLGDAEKLGCRIDISELPERVRTCAEERVGKPGILKLGLDAFLGLSDDFLTRWENVKLELKSKVGRVRSDSLCNSPYNLSPEEAEVISAMASGGKGEVTILQKHLGIIPAQIRQDLVPNTKGVVAAEELNFYNNATPKTSNAWGFVTSTPKVYPGGGKRPCRVSCLLGSHDGRSPVEVSYVFWAERGKETGHFLPKEAVDLQARLNSFHLRNIPISTVVRLNDVFARWDGSVATIKPAGESRINKEELADGTRDSVSGEVVLKNKDSRTAGSTDEKSRVPEKNNRQGSQKML